MCIRDRQAPPTRIPSKLKFIRSTDVFWTFTQAQRPSLLEFLQSLYVLGVLTFLVTYSDPQATPTRIPSKLIFNVIKYTYFFDNLLRPTEPPYSKSFKAHIYKAYWCFLAIYSDPQAPHPPIPSKPIFIRCTDVLGHLLGPPSLLQFPQNLYLWGVLMFLAIYSDPQAHLP